MVSSGQRLQHNRARTLLRQPCSGVKFSVVAGGYCDSKPVYTVGTTPWRHRRPSWQPNLTAAEWTLYEDELLQLVWTLCPFCRDGELRKTRFFKKIVHNDPSRSSKNSNLCDHEVYGRFPDGYFPGWSFFRIGRFPERRFPGGHFPGWDVSQKDFVKCRWCLTERPYCVYLNGLTVNSPH